MIINLLSEYISTGNGFDSVDVFSSGVAGLVTFTFLLYCILEGLQELRIIKLIQAKYFKAFGIFFEVLLFLAGIYILTISNATFISWWSIIIVFQVTGLLILIVVDIKKIQLRWRSFPES